MKTGIYVRNLEDLNDKRYSLNFDMDCVVCGDYGCLKIIPDTAELLKLKKGLESSRQELHYISPKVNQAFINEEAEKVMLLLNEGISVGINDWGLLYKIKPRIETEHQVYIGRLLVKSISNWAWARTIFDEEEKKEADYMVQSNFNHDLKIAFFKEWGVKGIEVNVNNKSEPSFASISAKGLKIMGYADNRILSVSRACPIARMKGINVSQKDCCQLCKESYDVIPVHEKYKEVYPSIRLHGNVLYQPIVTTPQWNGYEKLIYYYK